MSQTNSDIKIQIIVPVYNEGENIRTLYQGLLENNVAFDSLKFIYDFPEDSTIPVIANLAVQDSRITSEKNEFGRGVLNALRWGFNKAEDGPLLVLMGDNSDKLSIIPQMIALWENGATIVSPSRYMPGGKQFGGGFVKKNLSRLAGLSLYFFGFPTSDPTNNFKLYDGAWIRDQQIESTGGFEIALELSYKAFSQNKKISQLPTEWRDRTQGKSNFKFRAWLPKYLKWYLLTLKRLMRIY